jgi:hypothetical protein
MLDDLYSENVLNYLNFVLEYNNEELKKAAMEHISEMPNEKRNELFASNEWSQFSERNEALAQEICQMAKSNMSVDEN